jgi:tetratricopeptide (TPR) repeat protein
MEAGKKEKKRRRVKATGDTARLVQNLQKASGFSLHLLMYDSPAILKRKLKELTDEFEENLKIVDLGKLTDPVNNLLSKISRSAKNETIAVTAIESCVYPGKDEINLDFLPDLNNRLFEIREHKRPLVFFVPIDLIDMIKEDARDIWEWRSGFYLFEESDEDRYETAMFLCDHFLGSLHSENYDEKLRLLNLYKTLKLEYASEHSENGVVHEHALLGKIGCVLYKLGNYRIAFDYFKKQLDFCEIIGNDKLLPPVLNNIGMVYSALSNYDEALSYLQRAWDIGGKTLRGDNHPNKAIILSNIGEVHFHLGNLQDAFINCRQALRMCEKRLGMRHPNLVPLINKLARVFREQKQFEDALDNYRRALHIVEKQFEIDHPYLAVVLQNIGMTYFSQEKYDASRRYMYRTVEITERALGPEHPYLGLLLNNIGLTHYHNDHEKWALKYFEWALKIRKKSIGPQDLLIGTISNNVAKVYYNQGRYNEARTLLREAMEIYRLKLPEDHPEIDSVKQWILLVNDAQVAAKESANLQPKAEE